MLYTAFTVISPRVLAITFYWWQTDFFDQAETFADTAFIAPCFWNSKKWTPVVCSKDIKIREGLSATVRNNKVIQSPLAAQTRITGK